MWVGPSLVTRFQPSPTKNRKMQKMKIFLDIWSATSIWIIRSVQKFIFSIGTKMSGCPRLYLGTGVGVGIFQKFMRDPPQRMERGIKSPLMGSIGQGWDGIKVSELHFSLKIPRIPTNTSNRQLLNIFLNSWSSVRLFVNLPRLNVVVWKDGCLFSQAVTCCMESAQGDLRQLPTI